MKKLIVFWAGILLANPALAQSGQAPASKAWAPAEKPQTCEMMHNGMKMQGMMVKGQDGKMTCRMMDHSQMDHGSMGHGQKGDTANPARQTDHAGHEGHGPN